MVGSHLRNVISSQHSWAILLMNATNRSEPKLTGKRRAGRARRTPPSTADLPSVFRGVASASIQRLTSAAVMSDLPRRSVVYRPGDECTGLHVILSGRVKFSLPLSASKERVVAILGPGTWFGETALLLREPHGVVAETIQPTILALIPAQIVLRLLHQDAAFASKMLAEASRRLRVSMIEATHTSSSARRRVIGFLLEEVTSSSEGGSAGIVLPARKRVIASRLSLSPEHFSRVLRELTREDLIRMDGAHVSVPDLKRLREAYSRN